MIRFDRSRLRPGRGRELLLGVLERASFAVDPARCVLRALDRDERELRIGSSKFALSGRRVKAIAIGKAAVPMAAATSERLGPALTGGIAVTRYGYGGAVPGFRVLEAGHPIPDAGGVLAARAVAELADGAGADDLVLCLLSGGGSAVLAAPPEGVSIEELAEVTQLLLASGAPIDEVNAVRRHVSTLQGGRLARRLGGSTVISLVLSDVVGNRLEAVASGPTVPDPSTVADAIGVLRRHRLWDRIPDPVREWLKREETAETIKPGDRAFERSAVEIIGDNGLFLDAFERAGRCAGCAVVRIRDSITGEARAAGRALAFQALACVGESPEPTLIVAGGETTVTVRGRGRGGRNQELALAAAVEIARVDGVVVAALATDGTDGPTDAAGAIVDGRTIALAANAGIDARRALDDNDAHAALAAAGDLLFTGPTRTNVADVYVALTGVP